MADTHEEQLLSQWLRDIARQDEGLRADHLEAPVMSAVRLKAETTGYGKVRLKVRLKPDTTYYMKAAAVAICVVFPAVLWMTSDPAVETIRHSTNATNAAIAAPPTVTNTTTLTQPARPTPRTRRTRPTLPTRPTPPSLPTDEFVPLMPMSPQELAGPFQLVRVQMPRASLGGLRLPLDHPSELVEADVLLGEDGMARAIRVSAGGSIYPWRSR